MIDLFARHAHATVTSIVLPPLQSIQRCLHPDQIRGSPRQDVKTSLQLYFIAENKINNELEVRFNEM